MYCFKMKFSMNQTLIVGCRVSDLYKQFSGLGVFMLYCAFLVNVALAGSKTPVLTMHDDLVKFYPRQSYCLKLLEVIEDTGGFNGQPVICHKSLCRHYSSDTKLCASNGETTKTFKHQCLLCATGCHEMIKWKPIYRIRHEGRCTEKDFLTTTTEATTDTPSTKTIIENDYQTFEQTTHTPSPTTTYSPSFTTHITISTSQRYGSTTFRDSQTTMEQLAMIITDTTNQFTVDVQHDTVTIYAPTTETSISTISTQVLPTDKRISDTSTAEVPTSPTFLTTEYFSSTVASNVQSVTVGTTHVSIPTDDMATNPLKSTMIGEITKYSTVRETHDVMTTSSPDTIPIKETTEYNITGEDVWLYSESDYEVRLYSDVFPLQPRQELLEHPPVVLNKIDTLPIAHPLKSQRCTKSHTPFKIRCPDVQKNCNIHHMPLPMLPPFYITK